MSILSPEIGEETFEFNLDFDVPQCKWEDLQREKDLLDEGTWTAGSDIHDEWFKQVHPLHESKTNVGDQKEGKTALDRQGNKLSLGDRIKLLPNDITSSAGGDKTTKKGPAKRVDRCTDVETESRNRLSTKVDCCADGDKRTKKVPVRRVDSSTDVGKTTKKGPTKKVDSYKDGDKMTKIGPAKRVDSTTDVEKTTKKGPGKRVDSSTTDVEKTTKERLTKKVDSYTEVDKTTKKGEMDKRMKRDHAKRVDSSTDVEKTTRKFPGENVDSYSEIDKTTKKGLVSRTDSCKAKVDRLIKTVTSQRKSSGDDQCGDNRVKKPRRCWNLDGCHSVTISPNHTGQPKRSGCADAKPMSPERDSVADMDEELRAMLNTHNKKILKQRAEYDENGRKIQKGNPVLCPAPANKIHSNSPNTNVMLKTKRRSVNIVPSDVPKEAKQKRRSCFTLSNAREMPLNTITHSALSTGGQTKTAFATSNHKDTRTGINRQRSFKVAEKKAKEIPKTDAENEIEELIAQHNAKLAAKRKRAKK